MTFDDIDCILTRLETTGVTECEIEHGAQTLRLVFDRVTYSVSSNSPDLTGQPAVDAAPDTVMVRSPAIGIFREAHTLASGQIDKSLVRCGQHIGYLEIDSVLCPILAPADGALHAMLLQEGELTGYAQPVAEIRVDRQVQPYLQE
jgi:biotin carboxyl carrier protein